MILIENGTLIDPASGVEGSFSLVIESGIIRDVLAAGETREGSFEQRIDASGLWIVPGLIDLHVHLREPGQEWKETVETGARAAVAGGFTSICCMPNTEPALDSGELITFIDERARRAGLANVFTIGAVSLGREGKKLAPLLEMRSAGAVAFSDDGDPVWNAGMMRRALEWARELGCPISCHEEEKTISCHGCMNESALSERLGLRGMPKVAEDVMIARDIELARETGGQVHFCHVSTARGVELIRRAKNDGIPVSAEVTPHHLFLTEEAVGNYDTAAKLSPPLRNQDDITALREGLADGTIDAIASDHAPHEPDSKEVEFSEAAFGILGFQTSLPLALELVREGVLSRQRAIEALSASPARAFGLEGGTLKKGAAADITLIDPDKEWTFSRDIVLSKSFNSPFLGRSFTGKADSVFVGGALKFKDEKILTDGAMERVQDTRSRRSSQHEGRV